MDARECPDYKIYIRKISVLLNYLISRILLVRHNLSNLFLTNYSGVFFLMINSEYSGFFRFILDIYYQNCLVNMCKPRFLMLVSYVGIPMFDMGYRRWKPRFPRWVTQVRCRFSYVGFPMSNLGIPTSDIGFQRLGNRLVMNRNGLHFSSNRLTD